MDPGPVFMNPAAEKDTWRTPAGDWLYESIIAKLVGLIIEGFLDGLQLFTRPSLKVAFSSLFQKLVSVLHTSGIPGFSYCCF